MITPPEIRSAISRAKDELLLPDEYAAQASDRPYEQAIARVYRGIKRLWRRRTPSTLTTYS